MEDSIFRKKSLERIKSPEELNDYLHVTSPAIWLVLGVIIFLLAALFLWSGFTSYESSALGKGTVSGGTITVTFDDENAAANIESGMNVTVGNVTGVISSVGRDSEGRIVALAGINMADGVYDAKVTYKQTRILRLLID